VKNIHTYSENCLERILGIQETLFGGQLTLAMRIKISDFYIKRILLATDKNFGPLQFLFRKVSLCSNLLYVT
jgi:hypothetical protein